MELQKEPVDICGRLSHEEEVAIEDRKSSTCFNDKELWRVSRGQIEGTMEYNSKPEKEKNTTQISNVKGNNGAIILSKQQANNSQHPKRTVHVSSTQALLHALGLYCYPSLFLTPCTMFKAGPKGSLIFWRGFWGGGREKGLP